MPFVNVKVAGSALAPEQVQQLQRGATGLMAGVMRKRPDLTAVLVEQVPAAAWAVGGEPAPTAAHIEVTVTVGTNTAEEKARFVAEAMHLLRSVLGPDLNPVTYAVVREVPGDAWGWDGRTQAGRAATAQAA